MKLFGQPIDHFLGLLVDDPNAWPEGHITTRSFVQPPQGLPADIGKSAYTQAMNAPNPYWSHMGKVVTTMDAKDMANAQQRLAASLMNQHYAGGYPNYEWEFFRSHGLSLAQHVVRSHVSQAEAKAGGPAAYSRQLDDRIASAKERLARFIA